MIQHNLTTFSYCIHPKLSLLVLLKFYCINKIFKLNTNLPTGSVKVECSPPEWEVVSSSHSRVIPKT